MNNDIAYYPVKLLMYVIYDTTENATINRVVSASKTIEIKFTNTIEDTRLSDLIDYDLRGKSLKKITVHSEVSDLLPVYFDIVCTNGYRLENIPLYYLRRMAENEVYLNNIQIDPENSFLRFRNKNVINFKNHISFIY